MAEQTEELDHPRTNLFVAKSSDPKMLHKQPLFQPIFLFQIKKYPQTKMFKPLYLRY